MKIFRLKNLIFPLFVLALLFSDKMALAYTDGNLQVSEVLNSSGSTSASSYTHYLTVPAGYNDNYLLCYWNTSGRAVQSSLTYNGVAMTNLGQISIRGDSSYVYGLKNVPINQGNKPLVLNFTTSSYKDWYISCVAVSNIYQANPIAKNENTAVNTGGGAWNCSWNQYFANTKTNNPIIQYQSDNYGSAYTYENPSKVQIGGGSGGAAYNRTFYKKASPVPTYFYWALGGQYCYGMTTKNIELNLKPDVEITTPTQNQAYSNLLDTSITVSGNCKTNGTNQLTLQSSYVLPQQQPTCDCVNNTFSCDYNYGGYGNAQICVIDKTDTTAYDCKSYTLTKANLQTSYGTNPYFTAMPWSCDILGCRFPLASNASWAFEYSYDQDITPYSQYNAPFIVRPLNVPLNSTSTKLYVAEITNPYVVCNNCTSSYQVIQTLSNTTLNNLTATSSGFMYGGFDISTSTRYFLVSLKSATSTTIYQKQYISLSYSAAERPSGQPDFVWFQNTKDKLKGKLIFAQVFAFSDALNAFLNSTSTQANPLTFTMKSMSANNQFNLDIPVFDFTNPTVLNFAQRMRPLFIAGIWISFGFYLWNMFTKRLFRDDG